MSVAVLRCARLVSSRLLSVSSEREWLRSVSLTHLSEPLDSLSTQLCLCVATMARYDAARQWPALLPTLLSGMASGERVCCLRYTFALHSVAKQLQSVKSPQGRHTFAALAAAATPHIARQSRQHTERLCELVSGATRQHSATRRVAHGEAKVECCSALRRSVRFSLTVRFCAAVRACGIDVAPQLSQSGGAVTDGQMAPHSTRVHLLPPARSAESSC